MCAGCISGKIRVCSSGVPFDTGQKQHVSGFHGFCSEISVLAGFDRDAGAAMIRDRDKVVAVLPVAFDCF